MNKRFAKIYINTPNKNVVTQRYVTPSGLHIHTKWEIMILEKGTIYNQVNDYAFTDTHPGDVFIMGPSHRHILEITGEPSKLDAFVKVIEPYGILELARTGTIALSRGESCLNDLVDYNESI